MVLGKKENNILKGTGGFLARTTLKSAAIGVVGQSNLSPALRTGTQTALGASILSDSFATFLKTGRRRK